LCNADDKHSDASTTGPEAAGGSQSSANNLVATKFLVRVLLRSLSVCGIQNRAAARGLLWGAGAAPFNHGDMGNKSRGFSSCYKFGTNVNRYKLPPVLQYINHYKLSPSASIVNQLG
jgi:hypothetical protein